MIERDPEEKADLRFALNYGHTVGHALEAATGFTRAGPTAKRSRSASWPRRDWPGG